MSGQGQAQAPSGSFLCPGGFSSVGTGHVESGQIGSQAEHMLASPNGSAPGLASGFFPGGDGVPLAGIKCWGIGWAQKQGHSGGCDRPPQGCSLRCLQRGGAQDKSTTALPQLRQGPGNLGLRCRIQCGKGRAKVEGNSEMGWGPEWSPHWWSPLMVGLRDNIQGIQLNFNYRETMNDFLVCIQPKDCISICLC